MDDHTPKASTARAVAASASKDDASPPDGEALGPTNEALSDPEVGAAFEGSAWSGVRAALTASARDMNIDGRLLIETYLKHADDRRAAAAENKRLELERLRQVSDAQATSAELQARIEADEARIALERDAAERVGWVTRGEVITRFVLAVVLVFGTMFIVAWGIVHNRDPRLVSQYAAPVAGLAGLAVGYFFTRGTK